MNSNNKHMNKLKIHTRLSLFFYCSQRFWFHEYS